MLSTPRFRTLKFAVGSSRTGPSRKRQNALRGVEQLEDRLLLTIFAPAVDFPVGLGPFEVTAGDFDGDGTQDIATVDAGDSSIGVTAKVTVLLNTGTGFTPASGSPITIGVDARSLTAGDFNHDGMTDLAVANYAGSPGAVVRVFLAAGQGQFGEAPGSPYPVGQRPRQIETGDFNNDGNADLITANQIDNNLSVLLGTGTGTFMGAIHSPAANMDAVFAMTVADFNNDGNQDAAIVNHSTSGTLNVFLGNGSGGFGSPTSVLQGIDAIASGDFNEDGKQDLAATTGFSTIILLGDGTGDFAQPPGGSYAGGGADAVVADYDVDGNLDIATAAVGSSTVSVLLGSGSGSFIPAPGSPFAVHLNPFTLVAADFNQDCRPDLATSNLGSNDVSVLFSTLPDACNQPPTITSAAAVSAAENQTAVMDVESSDPDGESEGGGGLTYSLTGGADQALFSIDTNTGVLTFNAAPDFENPLDSNADNVYDVQTTVTDGGGLTGVQNIAVTVTNVNEAPAVAPATFNVDENSPNTTSVGAVTASDPDAGDSVTFSITAGNTSGAFAINSTTGEITVNNGTALDFETMPSFVLTVQAVDTGTLTGTASITINVNDIDPLGDTSAVIEEVQDLKDSGVLTNGQANPILNRLKQAIKAYNKGKAAHAVQKLEQARDEIQDLIDGGDLTPAQGQPLIDTINDIIDEILSGSALRASAVNSVGQSPGTVLTEGALHSIVRQALAFWDRTTGGAAALLPVSVQIRDLPRDYLGFASPTVIFIDADAAGYGWSIDAAGGMDLFSALTHEMGHVLGFDHHDALDVMGSTLAPRASRAPASIDVVTSFPAVVTHSRATYEPLDLPGLGFRLDAWIRPVELSTAGHGYPARPSRGTVHPLGGTGSAARCELAVDLALGEITNGLAVDDGLVEALACHLEHDDEGGDT